MGVHCLRFANTLCSFTLPGTQAHLKNRVQNRFYTPKFSMENTQNGYGTFCEYHISLFLFLSSSFSQEFPLARSRSSACPFQPGNTGANILIMCVNVCLCVRECLSAISHVHKRVYVCLRLNVFGRVSKGVVEVEESFAPIIITVCHSYNCCFLAGFFDALAVNGREQKPSLMILPRLPVRCWW